MQVAADGGAAQVGGSGWDGRQLLGVTTTVIWYVLQALTTISQVLNLLLFVSQGVAAKAGVGARGASCGRKGAGGGGGIRPDHDNGEVGDRSLYAVWQVKL